MVNIDIMKKMVLALLLGTACSLSLAADKTTSFAVSGIKLGMKKEEVARITENICQLKQASEVHKLDNGLTKWRCYLKPQTGFLKDPSRNDLHSLSIMMSPSKTVEEIHQPYVMQVSDTLKTSTDKVFSYYQKHFEKLYGAAANVQSISDEMISMCWGKPCSRNNKADITKEEASDAILLVTVKDWSESNHNSVLIVEHLSYLGAMYNRNRAEDFK